MNHLSSEHFLALTRPDTVLGSLTGLVDTTTLAAHDFDVDNRTGFMPPHPPLRRLPGEWESWELILDEAMEAKLCLGDKPHLSESEKESSRTWRMNVQSMPTLSTVGLAKSELFLRRAHHVLAWIMHFFVHTLPPDAPVHIPSPLTIPLLQVSANLQLPPVMIYSDSVLYNWALKTPSMAPRPALDNLRSLTLFTGTRDEEEFFLTSARMELRGTDALELMRATMDEAFVGDSIALRRITSFLTQLASVIRDLRSLLLAVREGCNPDVFFREIRPWFNGADSDRLKRPWIFEGIEDESLGLSHPTELSGASAGQSSLVHALDIFLGVDKYSHDTTLTGKSADLRTTSASKTKLVTNAEEERLRKKAFLDRMQVYMPRHHRAFLAHLSANTRPLRALIETSVDLKEGPGLVLAYNEAVGALKEFRDAHLIIVTLYVVSPANKLAEEMKAMSKSDGDHPGPVVDEKKGPLKGTGGTEMMKFLKGVRDQTKAALMNEGAKDSSR